MWVLVVVSYSNLVTMVARHDGHTRVVGSGPTWALVTITVVSEEEVQKWPLWALTVTCSDLTVLKTSRSLLNRMRIGRGSWRMSLFIARRSLFWTDNTLETETSTKHQLWLTHCKKKPCCFLENFTKPTSTVNGHTWNNLLLDIGIQYYILYTYQWSDLTRFLGDFLTNVMGLN